MQQMAFLQVEQPAEYHPKVRDLPAGERPVNRLREVGPRRPSLPPSYWPACCRRLTHCTRPRNFWSSSEASLAWSTPLTQRSCRSTA